MTGTRSDYSGDWLHSKRANYEHDRLEDEWVYFDESKENEVRKEWMSHSDGTTYQGISKVDMEMGAMYIERRYTEITDPKLIHRPLYWIYDHAPRLLRSL